MVLNSKIAKNTSRKGQNRSKDGDAKPWVLTTLWKDRQAAEGE